MLRKKRGVNVLRRVMSLLSGKQTQGVTEMTLFEEMVLDALNAGDYKAAIALIAAKEKVSKKC